MKKNYTTPQANVIRLQMESQILGASGFRTNNEVSNKEQLSDERGWADEWDTVEED